MDPLIQRLLFRWHRILYLRRQPQPWYKARLQEEILERKSALTRGQKLSETADVFYIISRAQHDGHPIRKLPTFTYPQLVVYAYLIPKYTLRWKFYRVAAGLSGCADSDSMREVVNPAKDHKVREVACRHGIDPEKFQRICRQLRLVWPLLP